MKNTIDPAVSRFCAMRYRVAVAAGKRCRPTTTASPSSTTSARELYASRSAFSTSFASAFAISASGVPE